MRRVSGLRIEKMKINYDKKSRLTQYKVDDRVWLRRGVRKPGEWKKLTRRWVVPYEIVIKITQLTYRVKSYVSKKRLNVHVNRMKACHSEAPVEVRRRPVAGPPRDRVRGGGATNRVDIDETQATIPNSNVETQETDHVDEVETQATGDWVKPGVVDEEVDDEYDEDAPVVTRRGRPTKRLAARVRRNLCLFIYYFCCSNWC